MNDFSLCFFWDQHESRLPEDIWGYRDQLPLTDEMNRKEESHFSPNCSNPSDMLRPKGTSTSVVLHTPPNSPPSKSVAALDLDTILDSFPEILETLPASTPQDFGSILNDLQSTFPGGDSALPFQELSPIKNVSSLETFVTPSAHHSDFRKTTAAEVQNVKKDIMLSWGSKGWTDNKICNSGVARRPVKSRSMSESSDSFVASTLVKPSPIRFTDEEYEHLPETPGVSDADAEDTELSEANENVCNITLYNSVGKFSVNSDHNYCEKRSFLHNASIDTPSSSDTDDEVDVESISSPVSKIAPSSISVSPLHTLYNNDGCKTKIVCKPISKLIHSGLAKVVSSCAADTKFPRPLVNPASNSQNSGVVASSAQVKRQLQITIQESMKNKQQQNSRRVGRPSKNSTCASPTISATASGENPIRPSPAERLGVAVPGASFRTHGKPEAYTKRMREQHEQQTESFKMPKRRKMVTDPCDSTDKRIEHNAMERQRRVGLRCLFENMKALLPSLEFEKKASKVAILKEATTISHYYTEIENSRSQLIAEQNNLLQRLSALDKKKAEYFRQTQRNLLC